MKNTLLLALLLAISYTKIFSQSAQSDFNLTEPTELSKRPKLTLWSTQYYIHKFQSSGKIPFVLSDGKETGLYADTCDFCASALEGTAFIEDSLGNITVINFEKTGEHSFVNCRACDKYAKSKLTVENFGKALWKISKGFGDGVLNYKLVPYRTIAVDKAMIPYGTVIFIPKVKGKPVLLPHGQKVIHDGYFFAGDTGGAIKGNHIDLFTGVFEGNPFIDVIQSNPTKTFEAFVITEQSIIDSLLFLHKK